MATIFLKNFSAGTGWLLGKIVRKSGPVSLSSGPGGWPLQDQLRSSIVSDGPPELSEI